MIWKGRKPQVSRNVGRSILFLIRTKLQVGHQTTSDRTLKRHEETLLTNSLWCGRSFTGSPEGYGTVSLGWYLSHLDEVSFPVPPPHLNCHHQTDFMIWASSVKSPWALWLKKLILSLLCWWPSSWILWEWKATLAFTTLSLRIHLNASLLEGYETIKFHIQTSGHDLKKEKPRLAEMGTIADLSGLSFHLIN